jgi:alanine dehydrogenase
MIVGVPKEIKSSEHRVGVTPSTGARIVKENHSLLVEKNAGLGIGASDSDYVEIGAQIVETAADVFARSDMIVKVKEPQEIEWKMLRKDQILFTYLHLAADPKQAEGLINSKCHAIAYETITDNKGSLPLLAPMSEIAGRLAVFEGAYHSKTTSGGPGSLISGVPGVKPSKVVILGGGMVGTNAAHMAAGLGADVTIFDKSIDRLRYLNDIFRNSVKVLYSETLLLEEQLCDADLIIGAVLIPGASAPKLIEKKFLSKMKKSSILVDVAIDQGGCFETSRPTTHNDPTYTEDGIIHYCVANMPGSVPKTASNALNNVTSDYILRLANLGMKALEQDSNLAMGLNVSNGSIMNDAVKSALNISNKYN